MSLVSMQSYSQYGEDLILWAPDCFYDLSWLPPTAFATGLLPPETKRAARNRAAPPQ